MQVFRREQKLAWLALFALATQLVCSFGHVHAHSAQRVAHSALPASCVSGTHAGCPSHDNDDEAHCSICWTISIAGSLVVPAPVALVVPMHEAQSVAPQPSKGTLGGNGSVCFQARAPPNARSFA
jgi:hypothetical protein